MCSGRTRQLLPQQHTHIYTFSITIFPVLTAASCCVCAEADPRNGATDEPLSSGTPQGGQRVTRLNSGTSFSHLHSRCVGLLSHCPNSLWECLCWRNSILSLPSTVHCILLFVVGVLPLLLPPLLFNAAPLVNTCEHFVSELRNSLMSLVGGGIY